MEDCKLPNFLFPFDASIGQIEGLIDIQNILLLPKSNSLYSESMERLLKLNFENKEFLETKQVLKVLTNQSNIKFPLSNATVSQFPNIHDCDSSGLQVLERTCLQSSHCKFFSRKGDKNDSGCKKHGFYSPLILENCYKIIVDDLTAPQSSHVFNFHLQIFLAHFYRDEERSRLLTYSADVNLVNSINNEIKNIFNPEKTPEPYLFKDIIKDVIHIRLIAHSHYPYSTDDINNSQFNLATVFKHIHTILFHTSEVMFNNLLCCREGLVGEENIVVWGQVKSFLSLFSQFPSNISTLLTSLLLELFGSEYSNQACPWKHIAAVLKFYNNIPGAKPRWKALENVANIILKSSVSREDFIAHPDCLKKLIQSDKSLYFAVVGKRYLDNNYPERKRIFVAFLEEIFLLWIDFGASVKSEVYSMMDGILSNVASNSGTGAQDKLRNITQNDLLQTLETFSNIPPKIRECLLTICKSLFSFSKSQGMGNGTETESLIISRHSHADISQLVKPFKFSPSNLFDLVTFTTIVPTALLHYISSLHAYLIQLVRLENTSETRNRQKRTISFLINQFRRKIQTIPAELILPMECLRSMLHSHNRESRLTARNICETYDIPLDLPQMLSLNIDGIVESVDSGKIENMTMFIGFTSSGKSTSINYLNGTHYTRRTNPLKGTKYLQALPSGRREMAIPGHSSKSQTLYPQLVKLDNGLCLADCPGYNDNRGDSALVCTTLGIPLLIHNCENVNGIAVVIEWGATELNIMNGGEFLRQMLARLSLTFKDVRKVFPMQPDTPSPLMVVLTKATDDDDPDTLRDMFRSRIESFIYERQWRFAEVNEKQIKRDSTKTALKKWRNYADLIDDSNDLVEQNIGSIVSKIKSLSGYGNIFDLIREKKSFSREKLDVFDDMRREMQEAFPDLSDLNLWKSFHNLVNNKLDKLQSQYMTLEKEINDLEDEKFMLDLINSRQDNIFFIKGSDGRTDHREELLEYMAKLRELNVVISSDEFKFDYNDPNIQLAISFMNDFVAANSIYVNGVGVLSQKIEKLRQSVSMEKRIISDTEKVFRDSLNLKETEEETKLKKNSIENLIRSCEEKLCVDKADLDQKIKEEEMLKNECKYIEAMEPTCCLCEVINEKILFSQLFGLNNYLEYPYTWNFSFRVADGWYHNCSVPIQAVEISTLESIQGGKLVFKRPLAETEVLPDSAVIDPHAIVQSAAMFPRFSSSKFPLLHLGKIDIVQSSTVALDGQTGSIKIRHFNPEEGKLEITYSMRRGGLVRLAGVRVYAFPKDLPHMKRKLNSLLRDIQQNRLQQEELKKGIEEAQERIKEHKNYLHYLNTGVEGNYKPRIETIIKCVSPKMLGKYGLDLLYQTLGLIETTHQDWIKAADNKKWMQQLVEISPTSAMIELLNYPKVQSPDALRLLIFGPAVQSSSSDQKLDPGSPDSSRMVGKPKLSVSAEEVAKHIPEGFIPVVLGAAEFSGLPVVALFELFEALPKEYPSQTFSYYDCLQNLENDEVLYSVVFYELCTTVSKKETLFKAIAKLIEFFAQTGNKASNPSLLQFVDSMYSAMQISLALIKSNDDAMIHMEKLMEKAEEDPKLAGLVNSTLVSYGLRRITFLRRAEEIEDVKILDSDLQHAPSPGLDILFSASEADYALEDLYNNLNQFEYELAEFVAQTDGKAVLFLGAGKAGTSSIVNQMLLKDGYAAGSIDIDATEEVVHQYFPLLSIGRGAASTSSSLLLCELLSLSKSPNETIKASNDIATHLLFRSIKEVKAIVVTIEWIQLQFSRGDSVIKTLAQLVETLDPSIPCLSLPFIFVFSKVPKKDEIRKDQIIEKIKELYHLRETIYFNHLAEYNTLKNSHDTQLKSSLHGKDYLAITHSDMIESKVKILAKLMNEIMMLKILESSGNKFHIHYDDFTWDSPLSPAHVLYRSIEDSAPVKASSFHQGSTLDIPLLNEAAEKNRKILFFWDAIHQEFISINTKLQSLKSEIAKIEQRIDSCIANGVQVGDVRNLEFVQYFSYLKESYTNAQSKLNEAIQGKETLDQEIFRLSEGEALYAEIVKASSFAWATSIISGTAQGIWFGASLTAKLMGFGPIAEAANHVKDTFIADAFNQWAAYQVEFKVPITCTRFEVIKGNGEFIGEEVNNPSEGKYSRLYRPRVVVWDGYKPKFYPDDKVIVRVYAAASIVNKIKIIGLEPERMNLSESISSLMTEVEDLERKYQGCSDLNSAQQDKLDVLALLQDELRRKELIHQKLHSYLQRATAKLAAVDRVFFAHKSFFDFAFKISKKVSFSTEATIHSFLEHARRFLGQLSLNGEHFNSCLSSYADDYKNERTEEDDKAWEA